MREAGGGAKRIRIGCSGWNYASWRVYAILREHGVALVIGDRPEVKPFQAHVFTAPWTFVPFHYG